MLRHSMPDRTWSFSGKRTAAFPIPGWISDNSRGMLQVNCQPNQTKVGPEEGVASAQSLDFFNCGDADACTFGAWSKCRPVGTDAGHFRGLASDQVSAQAVSQRRRSFPTLGRGEIQSEQS